MVVKVGEECTPKPRKKGLIRRWKVMIDIVGHGHPHKELISIFCDSRGENAEVSPREL